jgi:hypothetical protein
MLRKFGKKPRAYRKGAREETKQFRNRPLPDAIADDPEVADHVRFVGYGTVCSTLRGAGQNSAEGNVPGNGLFHSEWQPSVALDADPLLHTSMHIVFLLILAANPVATSRSCRMNASWPAGAITAPFSD